MNQIDTLGGTKGIKVPGFLETLYWLKICPWAILDFQFTNPVMG